MDRDAKLLGIRNIIERVENRCMAADGPVINTRTEMTDEELREIYVLAGGKVSGADNTTTGEDRSVAREQPGDTPARDGDSVCPVGSAEFRVGDHVQYGATFEDMIRSPSYVAGLLQEFLAFEQFDAHAAAGVVRPRSPDCYPGLLEAELVEARW